MSERDAAILEWEAFAYECAYKWRPFAMEREDAKQEAIFALVKMADTYKPLPKGEPKSRFGTWAKTAILGHMQKLWRKASAAKRTGDSVPLYLTNDSGEVWERPEVAVEPQEVKADIGLMAKLERAIDELSPRQRGVIRARYGLDGEPQTPKEIAKAIHRTHTAVYIAEKEGIRKLRVALAGLATCLCLMSGCATKPLPTPAKTLVTTPDFQPRLRLYGLGGRSYQVQGSTNGTDWFTLETVTMPASMTTDVALTLPYSTLWTFRTVTP